jgi:hypothetical protein
MIIERKKANNFMPVVKMISNLILEKNHTKLLTKVIYNCNNKINPEIKLKECQISAVRHDSKD